MGKLVIAGLIAATAVGTFIGADGRISRANMETAINQATSDQLAPAKWQYTSWVSCQWVEGLYQPVRVCN